MYVLGRDSLVKKGTKETRYSSVIKNPKHHGNFSWKCDSNVCIKIYPKLDVEIQSALQVAEGI